MKTSRIKYSKFNARYSQFVQNVDNIKDIKANDFKELRTKQKRILQAKTDNQYGCENIFIETEDLYNFFSNIQINKEADIAQQMYFALKNRKYIEPPFEDSKMPFRLYVFRLYAPINKVSTSLAVSICCTKTFNEGLDLNYISFFDANSFQDILLHKETVNILETGIIRVNNEIIKDKYTFKIYEYFKVIINLIFYMNAYPENVLDGVPQKAIIDNNISIGQNRITISKNIELFYKHEIAPHLRRGHFRTFTSDYYVHKQGETIWIEPMFIKGEAKTVIEIQG